MYYIMYYLLVDLDGQNYGECGVAIDLRFIPDEIDFSEDIPRLRKTSGIPDVCSQVPRNYEMPDFVTSALTRSQVNLTWDETDRKTVPKNFPNYLENFR